ncbi:MAG: hypothetical protein SFW67_32350 [Myxococcaceae bacterium]|nr:hypothetical protein [Myxococcaceae bacterium]
MNDIVDIAWKVARAFEAVGIEYSLGGSVASLLQATARSTNDIDFVVELHERQVPELILALGEQFAVEDEGLIERPEDRRCALVREVRASSTHAFNHARPRGAPTKA